MNRSEIREHFRKLGNGEIQPLSNKRGICFEIYQRFGQGAFNALLLSFMNWPKHSGRTLYPLPGGNVKYREYSNTKNMWDPNDEYGALRLEACRWLAENY